MNPPASKSCLVIGAGIAGLLAAQELQRRGVSVLVLDKGRGVGGRMATRRIDQAVFDHGAQFFTTRSDEFSARTHEWLESGAARKWCDGFARSEGAQDRDGHARYCGVTGMTGVPKLLAQSVEVQTGMRVTSVAARGAQWAIETEQGRTFESDMLLLTAPAPQSLAILQGAGTALNESLAAALNEIRFDPCIAVMAQPLESAVPAPGGLQLPGEPISWIGDNVQKGISPTPSITIHAGPEFSRTHWSGEESEVAEELLAAARHWVGETQGRYQVHRWRYARPSALHSEPCLALRAPLPLAIAGDAFGSAKVEGAALSGLAAARALFELA